MKNRLFLGIKTTDVAEASWSVDTGEQAN